MRSHRSRGGRVVAAAALTASAASLLFTAASPAVADDCDNHYYGSGDPCIGQFYVDSEPYYPPMIEPPDPYDGSGPTGGDPGGGGGEGGDNGEAGDAAANEQAGTAARDRMARRLDGRACFEALTGESDTAQHRADFTGTAGRALPNGINAAAAPNGDAMSLDYVGDGVTLTPVFTFYNNYLALSEVQREQVWAGGYLILLGRVTVANIRAMQSACGFPSGP